MYAEFNDWLTANGFDPETVSEASKPVLQAAWRASLKPTPVPAPVPTPNPAPGNGSGNGGGSNDPVNPDAQMEAILAQGRAERQRRTAITELVASTLSANPDQLDNIERVGRMAIDGSWTVQRAELELLRTGRGPGPMVYAPAQPEASSEVLEAALCRAGGLKSLESAFTERTLNTLDRTHRRGIGMHQLIGMAARQNGWRGESVRHDLGRAMKAAFRDRDDDYGSNGGHGGHGRMNVGPSTISVSGILSNVANKFLREAFMFVEQEWRKISAIRSVSDFKEITSYSLTGDATYDEVAPGGELKHATLGNETYGNAAKTYGKIIGIDRRDMINDDLGAFASVNKRLGRGGALKLNDVFWTAFLADPTTFWTALRGNYDDGTDTAFGNDGLVAADIIWSAKTDPDGKVLGSKPRFLLVPPTHKIPAWRLMRSEKFGANDEEGEANPWAGRYEMVCSQYLSNSTMGGGYSPLAYYLLADPNDLAVIETCFLDGQEMPTIESVEMDADRLGMAMRAWHDFGCRKQEYRGGLKLKGEN